jgi:hypothetical protein
VKTGEKTVYHSEAQGTYLSVVDADNTSNHLRNDNHVAEVSLHNGGFLIRRCLLLRFPEFFDETHWAALQATLEPTAGASVNELPTIKSV